MKTFVLPSRSNAVRSLAPALLLAWLAAAGWQSAAAAPQPGRAPAAAPAPAPAPAGSRTYRLPLSMLGAEYPLQLRGVAGSGGVPFSVRADEVVVAARLRLNYSYSPALLPKLSHLKVLLNSEVAATLPVPAETAGQALQQEIVLPPRMITEFNRLNIQLIGHYTTECEDPAHSSLWANVGTDSELVLTTMPLALANDLALLPRPLFDRRDMRRLELPVVFAGGTGTEALEAAGTVASWFGALASYRGSRFPVGIDRIPPQGHAIVLAPPGARLEGLALPEVAGPTLSLLPNPHDPHGKLLVLSGRKAGDLRTAARALTLGTPGLSGPQAAVVDTADLAPRQPYDAPNWLPGDRPVRFGELAAPDQFNVSGYFPDLVRVNFQLPPDLFAWRTKGVGVDLRYRYSPQPDARKSALNVSVNGQYLRSLPLLPAATEPPGALERWVGHLLPAADPQPARARFHIPLFKLPARNQLQFHFQHEIVKQGECKAALLDNVWGAVEPDSTIDLSGLHHFLAMPDLAAFANSGFPYTRMADLSDTAVILPARPEPDTLEAYLGLMALMGRSTGHPATAVTVADAARVHEAAGKDLLVVGSPASQPLLQEWSARLPVRLDGDVERFRIGEFAHRLFTWWRKPPGEAADPGRLAFAFRSGTPAAMLAGFESPLASGRSVVVVASNQPGGLGPVLDALLDPERVRQIQGSAALVRADRVSSLESSRSYHVGRLPPLVYLQWYLSSRPLLLVALAIAGVLVAGALLFVVLRARARARLRIAQ